MDNHFALFQMTPAFAIDAAALDAAYRELQGRVHPDKFANATDTEKRVAMQWATRANEAYQTLKNPLKRATYLCELNGVDLGVRDEALEALVLDAVVLERPADGLRVRDLVFSGLVARADLQGLELGRGERVVDPLSIGDFFGGLHVW